MQPYLIQRGTFKPVPDQEILGLDTLISYDYMGSSEFEWGALPASLTKICKSWDTYKISRIDEIQDLDGNYLYFVAPESFKTSGWPEETATHETLVGVIKTLFSEKYPYRLKERCECYDRIHGDSFTGRISDTNFWWDVENNWMMCFGKDIQRLILAIQKVCVKKALPYEGGPSVKDSVFSTPVFAMDALKNKVTVTDFGGRTTIISLLNVKNVAESPEAVVVLVRTRAGVDKELDIQIKPCAKRDFLVQLLKDRIDYNTHRNA
jgi:hypothetical protein